MKELQLTDAAKIYLHIMHIYALHGVDRYCRNSVQLWHEKNRISAGHRYYLIMQNGSSHTVFQIRRAHKYTFCSYAQYPS